MKTQKKKDGWNKMFAYRNTEDIRKKIDMLIKKGHFRKNLNSGEYELTKKGIKKCKKIGLKIGFIE